MESGGTRSFVVRALTLGVVASVALPLVLTSAVEAKRPPVVPPPVITPTAADPFATDQLIVKMKDGSIPNVANLIAQAGENVQLKHRESNGAWVGKLGGRRTSAAMTALAAKIAALPGVAYAEPDAIMVPYFTPTDPNYGAQWDLVAPVAGKYGANLPTAWDTTKGTSDVVVAVIDTGITNHADLAGQTVPGYDMITDPVVANDGNGRDADPSDPGDWVSSADSASGALLGCPVSNSSWHGTHVAGTIAALQNNGIGVTGIAPGVKVEPVRVLGKCGGYTSDIADALRWAAGLNVPGVPANANPAAVLSLSLGGTGTCPATYSQAISDITAIGATVVIAAGNSNADTAGYNPGNCPGVITVAATGPTGNRAYYSNFGTGIEIAAQGGDTSLTAPAGSTSAGILSTMNAGTTTPATDTYAYYQGTSMATPHVSGVAALIKSVDPAATPAQVLSFIQNNVTAFPAGSTCTTALCGPGILNAAAAVSAAATAYGSRVLGAFSKTSPAPGTLAVTDPVTLTWTASAGATSYDYCVVATLTAPCTWTTAGNVTSVTVSGLTPGTLYSWQVRATNGTNTAEANVSLRSSFTTWAPTPAPTAFTKTAPANASQVGGSSTTLSWSASTNTVSYEYCIDSTQNGSCDGTWTSTLTATSATVSGLVVGTTYEWAVRAVNPTGTTYADGGSYFTFTDTTLPSAGTFTKTAPLNAGTVTGTTASLTWAASANATGYDVCLDSVVDNACTAPAVWNVFGNISSVTATGLVAGTTYEWQVRANASGGSTLADNATAFTFLDTAALPGAFNKSTPASLSTGLATTPTLGWNASTGATSYEYCIDTSNDNACTTPAVWVSTGTARTAPLTGLLNSTTYYWQVRARNTGGTTDANTGAWWSFTTAAPAVPGAFTKSAPLNAATGVAIAPTLSWAASASASGYEYCIDTTADSTCNSGVWTSTGTARTAALTGLAYSTTYQWQVRSRNAVGTTDATTGTWWTFTTVAPPVLGAFNKSTPATNATGQGSTGTVTLTWAASTNATSFEYCIDAVVNSICDSGVWTTTPVLATRSVAFTGFTWNTKYEWQVRARNAGGTLDANAGTWFTFTTLAPPASPAKTAPTNGQTARPLTQALSWGAATGAVSYEYCIDTTNNSTCDSNVWITTGTARTASPAGLVTKTTYYWQVRARNAAGATEGNAGTWWSFITA